MVAADFHIPLFHKVYAGHLHDSVELPSITAELAGIRVSSRRLLGFTPISYQLPLAVENANQSIPAAEMEQMMEESIRTVVVALRERFRGLSPKRLSTDRQMRIQACYRSSGRKCGPGPES
jgi:hypothetical protein